jgi:hypothetical protein
MACVSLPGTTWHLPPRSGPGGTARRRSGSSAACWPPSRTFEGVPSLVEIVIPEKDLAPQLARLAAAPTDKRKLGRSGPEEAEASPTGVAAMGRTGTAPLGGDR